MSPILNPTSPAPSLTPKSLLRRSTLVRKREETGEDEPPSSPGKRARVTFDSDVEIRTVDDLEKPPEIIYDEVRRAMKRRLQGESDDAGYNKLKEVYAHDKDGQVAFNPKTMMIYASAILANISAFRPSDSDLVHPMIQSDWLGGSEDYFFLFMRLLANLVSLQGVFLGDVMRMLVDNLTIAPPTNGRIPKQPEVKRSVLFGRAHKAILHILQVVPSASRMLSVAIVHGFPHETDSRRAHVIYVQNLLQLIEYTPELRGEILTLVTERLVKIDVQIQNDLEDLAEEIGEGLVDKIPQIRPDLLDELEDSDFSDEDEETDEDDEDPNAPRTRNITKDVEKIDAMLDILFSHYNQAFTKSSMSHQIITLNLMLSQFVTVILPTHRSRHTQFLLFHFSQQSAEHIDAFVGACAQITFDKSQPAIMRQSSAAYLASFVARGTHVSTRVVREVFEYIASELERLRGAYEPTCHGPDLRRYSSFYVLVQAMLYIFCFRWQDLKANLECDFEDDGIDALDQEHHWLSGVKETLSLNIFSPLNPLKLCSPAIVSEWARVANHLGIIYVYHLLETNKRVRVQQYTYNAYGQINRATALSARGNHENQHLDEYFPFDPYHLPKSKRWIEGDYREWQGVRGLRDEETNDSSEEEAEEEEANGTETDVTDQSF